MSHMSIATQRTVTFRSSEDVELTAPFETSESIDWIDPVSTLDEEDDTLTFRYLSQDLDCENPLVDDCYVELDEDTSDTGTTCAECEFPKEDHPLSFTDGETCETYVKSDLRKALDSGRSFFVGRSASGYIPQSDASGFDTGHMSYLATIHDDIKDGAVREFATAVCAQYGDWANGSCYILNEYVFTYSTGAFRYADSCGGVIGTEYAESVLKTGM